MIDEEVMDIETAIEELKKHTDRRIYYDDFVNACQMGIQALEKQIPKDPLVYDTENTMMYELPWDDSWGYECPCCGNRDIDYGYMFCECGQALKWE